MKKRTDQNGKAFKGSQFQIQTYISQKPNDLSSAILDELTRSGTAATQLFWMAPLENEHFKEPIGLGFLEEAEKEKYADKISIFWPQRGGPHWDAVAVINDYNGDSSKKGILLVEAKSYAREMNGKGCGAKFENGGNRKLIEDTVGNLQLTLGTNVDVTSWMNSKYYQYVNRLAHLHFLRRHVNHNTWLVNLYFINDMTLLPRQRGADRDSWQKKIWKVKEELGLNPETKIPGVVDVYLPAINNHGPAYSASGR